MTQKRTSKHDTKNHKHQSFPWHNVTEEAVLEKLQTNKNGLDNAQAEKRLSEYGPNTLPSVKPPTLFEVIFHQFKSPLIYILLIAAFIAMIIGDVKDAIFIFAVVLLNAIIGTTQEWKAEQKALALQTLLKIRAKVRRDKTQISISAEQLVPGDIVLVESGDKVPADLRLIQANNLAIDESFLTGESIAVDKSLGVLEGDNPVSDRSNMAFAGATVITGRGTGIVVETGKNTEVGQIATSLTTAESAKPPLLIRMEKFAQQVSFVVLGFAFVLGAVSMSRGTPFAEVFFLMVAMVVSAIPEGLPVAMTVALSIATARMAKRNVIVRKLMAVESLGSCTMIASDKTGTLTVNQQTVKKLVLPDGLIAKIDGQGYNSDGEALDENDEKINETLKARLIEIARSGILCNEASLNKENDGWNYSGDAMDIALLFFASKLSLEIGTERDRYKIIGEIPFESEKRYAATAYTNGKESMLTLKGAVETILPFCVNMKTETAEHRINNDYILNQAQQLAEDGYRVLAIASKTFESDGNSFKLGEEHLKDLILLGLIGFIDPLRPEVKSAVEEALGSGVRVIMITGDHPSTALAIAKELGIASLQDEVVTGQELETISAGNTSDLLERIKTVRVFARVTPQQKLQIVDALVKLGEFVAVTGDGVNDAPALRRANIGVAMGSGTDIAKEASLITIADDNFASIVAGIEEGRYAYANVRKVTLLLISTGAAELILLGSSIIMRLPVPLLAVQILWLNLVTNGIQDVALAFEAGEKGVMKLPPRRPNEGMFDRKMIEQVLIAGLTMGIVCLAFWIILIGRIDIGDEQALAIQRIKLFTLLVMMQFYHVFNSRSETISAFRIPMANNPILIVGTLLAFLIHVSITRIPFMRDLLLKCHLETCPLDKIQSWIELAAIASVVMIAMEIYKFIKARPKKRVA